MLPSGAAPSILGCFTTSLVSTCSRPPSLPMCNNHSVTTAPKEQLLSPVLLTASHAKGRGSAFKLGPRGEAFPQGHTSEMTGKQGVDSELGVQLAVVFICADGRRQEGRRGRRGIPKAEPSVCLPDRRGQMPASCFC